MVLSLIYCTSLFDLCFFFLSFLSIWNLFVIANACKFVRTLFVYSWTKKKCQWKLIFMPNSLNSAIRAEAICFMDWLTFKLYFKFINEKKKSSNCNSGQDRAVINLPFIHSIQKFFSNQCHEYIFFFIFFSLCEGKKSF